MSGASRNGYAKIPLWEPPLKEFDHITQGEKTKRFEEEFAKFVGQEFAVATTSGTVAIFLSLKAVGVGFGDNVVIPAFTARGTMTGVRLTGATVTLTDVSKDDFLITLPRGWVSDNVKAVVPVHLNGRHVDVVRLRETVSKHLYYVEDACQALGCRKVGNGDLACYSFSPTKTIHTGQGGIVTTDSPYIYETLVKLRSQGQPEGYNFKFTDLQAEIGLTYLEQIDDILRKKRRVYWLYEKELRGLNEVKMVPFPLEVAVPWMVDIIVSWRVREKLMAYLKVNGVESRRFYPPLDVGFPNAKYLYKSGLWLPSSVHLTQEQIGYVCDKIKEFFE